MPRVLTPDEHLPIPDQAPAVPMTAADADEKARRLGSGILKNPTPWWEQLTGPGGFLSAPQVGSLAGSLATPLAVTALGVTNPWLVPLVGLTMAGAGGGLGRAGEILRRRISGAPSEPQPVTHPSPPVTNPPLGEELRSVNEAAGTGALQHLLGETGGALLGAGARRFAAPALARMTARTPAVQEAQALGLQTLPASVITGSPLVRTAEWFARHTPHGTEPAWEATRALQGEAEAATGGLAKSISPSAGVRSNEQVGAEMLRRRFGGERLARRFGKLNYTQAGIAARGTDLEAPRGLKVLEDTVKRVSPGTGSPTENRLRQMYNELADAGGIPAALPSKPDPYEYLDRIHRELSEMGRDLKGVPGRENEHRLVTRAANAFRYDIEQGLQRLNPKARQMRRLADRYWKEKVADPYAHETTREVGPDLTVKVTNRAVQTIDANTETPSRIIPELLKAGGSEPAPELFDMAKRAVGPGAWTEAQAGLVWDWKTDATTESGDFLMNKFRDKITAYRPEVLARLFDPGRAREMQRFARAFTDLEKNHAVQPLHEEGSPWGLGLHKAGIAAFAFEEPLAAAGAYLGRRVGGRLGELGGQYLGRGSRPMGEVAGMLGGAITGKVAGQAAGARQTHDYLFPGLGEHPKLISSFGLFVITPQIAARLFFTEPGIRLVTKAIQTPPGTGRAARLLNQLAARAARPIPKERRLRNLDATAEPSVPRWRQPQPTRTAPPSVSTPASRPPPPPNSNRTAARGFLDDVVGQ